MAKDKKREEKTDYSALLRELRENGPQRLYLLWGAEDYLRESFFGELKKICLGDGSADFNYHRLNGENLDYQKLSQAVDAVPFMGEHTFIELRNFDLNSCKDDKADRLKDIVSDIPDYACLVIILPTAYEADGRLAAMKMLKKQGTAIEFTTQPQSLLVKWISTRFAAMGKVIEREACERLIFVSGELMTRLVPEIEKIGSYVSGDKVRSADIDKLAQRIPEASVFEMTDALSEKNYNKAAALMAELLQSGEHPIKILAMIGFQMRRVYCARVGMDSGRGRDFIVKTYGINFPFLVDKLMKSAANFTLPQLKRALELCAQADYQMKSSSLDDEGILKELLLRLAVGDGQ